MTLLELEARASGLAARLEVDPGLAAAWRAVAALEEAAASVALEDVSVPPWDLLAREIGLGPDPGDPRAIRTAGDLRRVLLSAGPAVDPETLLRRSLTAVERTLYVPVETRLVPMQDPRVLAEEWEQALAAIAAGWTQVAARPAPPVLKALGIAGLAARLSPDRWPAFERLVFLWADAWFREAAISPFGKPVAAPTPGWVLMPGLALTREGYGVWQPNKPETWERLFKRLSLQIGREAGRIGLLQDWRGRAGAWSAGRGNRSRHRTLLQAAETLPVFRLAEIAAAADVTERAARNIVLEAVSDGLLVCLTPRRSYRIFALPAFGDLNGRRDRHPARREGGSPRRRGGIGQVASGAADPEQAHAARSSMTEDAAIARALAELDAAMTGADQVIAKYGAISDHP
ncbi:hypothetical protein [Amaricoccus macauensis]|uniref:hypothetical protein n=1 Tax=Amaricoccus macauensis TaxID=57001 RepID=UPI003C79C1EB